MESAGMPPSERDNLKKRLENLRFEKRTHELELKVFMKSKKTPMILEMIGKSKKKTEILENLRQVLKTEV